ncbi:MAG: Hsp20/alpha crystallin family protein [Bacteroidetes bacterium]|nr:Hsp20/alpha crystallin family protein [Bacteroidota bacterium]
MYNKHGFAPFIGAVHGRRQHPFIASVFRAPVNVYKTDNSYEIMVFAPGRIKENFNVSNKGNELVISYAPPDGLPVPDWTKKEYSRGGFERSFTLDDSVDASRINAVYTDGVLQVSIPFIPGKEPAHQDIPVN